MTTKVTIDAVEYDIDLEKAKQLGLIKRSWQPITELHNGDLFYYTDGTSQSLIVQAGYNKAVWVLCGRNYRLDAWVNGGTEGEGLYTTAELLEKLNQSKAICIGNVNDHVKDWVKSKLENYGHNN